MNPGPQSPQASTPPPLPKLVQSLHPANVSGFVRARMASAIKALAKFKGEDKKEGKNKDEKKKNSKKKRRNYGRAKRSESILIFPDQSHKLVVFFNKTAQARERTRDLMVFV